MSTQAIEQTVRRHTEHVEKTGPGDPAHLSSAHQPGDGVWQGDLGIEIVDGVPADYVRIEAPTDADRQLVPAGGGPGSNHRLRSLDGVELYRPKEWGRDETDLRGPCVVFSSPNAIVHEPGHDKPHGTVFVDNPMTILCRYQRNLDAEERATRAFD